MTGRMGSCRCRPATPGSRRMSMDSLPSSLPGEAGNSGDRKSSLTGEDSDLEMFQQWQEQAFVPLKEDVADWLNKTLDIDITVDNFMDSLDNAVCLCRLAKLIQTKAAEYTKAGKGGEQVPQGRIMCRENAQSGTWFARDNTANFLKWCREYGVMDECLFETEGLVLHREEKRVILLLLELARIGYKYGIEPTNLIKLENEIDRETQDTPNKNGPSQVKGRGSTATKGQQPPRKRLGSGKSVDELDKQVQSLSGVCKCQNCFHVNRISQGHYNIGGKNVFVRLLKGKHVMVRVGGGWDTMQHYLATHDPCKIIEFKRRGSQAAPSRGQQKQVGDGDKCLYIRSKYKA